MTFQEEIVKRQQIVTAIVNLAHFAAEGIQPEGCREYAEVFSLHIRDAVKHLSKHPMIVQDLKAITAEKADDAGMSSEEAFEYWTPEYME